MQSADLDWGPEDDWDDAMDWAALEQQASKRLKTRAGQQSDGPINQAKTSQRVLNNGIKGLNIQSVLEWDKIYFCWYAGCQ